MKYLLKYNIVSVMILFVFIACEDPAVTNPADPKYKLSPPTDLTAEAGSDTTITLNWRDNEPNETGFIIERDAGSGFMEIGGVGSDVTEYTDGGLVFGQIYYYRVAAYSSVNISLYSDTASSIALGSLVDYDGNVYRSIKIGDQVWIADNLKVTHFRDGTQITHITEDPEWIGLTTEAYCIYENNSSNEVETYGALYSWYAIADSHNIAPIGWHVPTDAEWKELEIFLGMSQDEADARAYRGINEGSKLAGNPVLWADGTLKYEVEFGSSSFSALPGGYRGSWDGSFLSIETSAYFWSSTDSESGSGYAWYRSFYYRQSSVIRNYSNSGLGYSIRLVKD